MSEGIARGVLKERSGVVGPSVLLKPIKTIRSCLRYAIENLDGAMRHPFLAGQALEHLEEAADYVHRASVPSRHFELLIWDAFRTLATQRAIFDRHLAELRKKELSLTDAELHRRATFFVRDPNTVFPHGTGGAVDVTLLINGQSADMGTDFDSFIPQAAPDWFRNNRPATPAECLAARNREILRTAMENAGFVGIDSEWWHYEFGTLHWANTTGQAIILDRILSPPILEEPAAVDRIVPRRQPILEFGVAQPFLSSEARKAALRHEVPGHYYVRHSHPTGELLGKQLRLLVPAASGVILTQNGLSACLSTVRAIVPEDGTLVYDKYIYYEVERGLIEIAASRRWKLVALDFLDLATIRRTLQGMTTKVQALYCDNPRNWWLDSLDVKFLAHIARESGASLIVDTSVQPVQDPLSVGATVCVISLSKYPSLGLTAGGAILTNDSDIFSKVAQTTESAGHGISPEAANTILSQIVSLRDRMASVSIRAEVVAARLTALPFIRHVRIPDAALSGGFVGGQISFHLATSNQGPMLESVVACNALQPRNTLHLACTFGACITTIEHFTSNPRHRSGVQPKETNESDLPDDLVRLGLGCEPTEDVWSDLCFALKVSHELADQSPQDNTPSIRLIRQLEKSITGEHGVAPRLPENFGAVVCN